MNSIQLGLRVAGTVFALVCLAHLCRLVLHVPVILGGHDVPAWLSGLAAVGSGLLGLWLWLLSLPRSAAPGAGE